MAGSNRAAQQIVETAFAAAVDGALWDEVTTLVMDQVGSNGSFLGIADEGTGGVAHASLNRATSRAYEEYLAGMAFTDPQQAIVRNVRHAQIYLDTDHLDWSDAAVRDYMGWQIDRLGWHGHVTLCSRLSERFISGFSFHFPADDADAAAKARAFLQPIAGQLAQALQLGYANGERLIDEYWRGLARTLDRTASVLLAEDGRPIRVNAPGERMLERGCPLGLRAGRLTCSARGEQERFDHAFAHAADPIAPVSMIVLLSEHRAARYLAKLVPVVRRRRDLVIDEPAVLLTLAPLAQPTGSKPALWRAIFGLTGTEALIADHLRLGQAAESIAAARGLKVGTIRTHIKAIHDKTETRRNAELAHLLTLIASEACAPEADGDPETGH